MKIYLLAATFLASSCAYAQESRTETQAIRCAALSLIHTSLTDSNPAFGDAMTRLAMLYGAVYASTQAARTGATLTMGKIEARREVAVEEFKMSWRSSPDVVVREAALCNAWRSEFGPRLAASDKRDDEPEFLRLVGQPPARPSGEEVERWRPLVPLAFSAWAELGYATPSSMRAKVRESLIESLRKP